ncbi:MAG: FkbM family methyltransferase [Thermodesulfovibrionales bacterium]|nr:FkbM family methyltransferase [Thermodesulfovibrionales bacterium]
MTYNISWSDSASSIKAVHAENRGGGIKSTVEIQVKTLDKLVFEQQILPPPQHIKIDTEGFEVPILLGAKETLRKYRPFVYVEIHTVKGFQDNEKDIRQVLDPHHYSIQRYGMQLLCVPEHKLVQKLKKKI